MDLSYGSELEDFRSEVESFLEQNWPLRGADSESSRAEQTRLFRRRAIEAKYLARNIPRQYGGSEQEAAVLRGQIIREQFTAARAPMEARGIGTMMLVPTLLERGAEWQKEKFVEGTILGDIKWCQGYSEPGSGSDLASLKTRGELQDGQWVINGQKIWTSGAHEADYMFILVRTEPDAPKHAGISYLLLDMKQPGIDTRPLKQMTGDLDFNEVFLSDARTPEDWIVGKRGEGWSVSRTTLKHERNSIGASAQTAMFMQGLLRLAKGVSKNGRPAIEDPEVRQRLAQLEGYVLSHKYSSFYQLTKDIRGENPGIIAMMMKLISTNIGHDVARLSMDLLGEDGLLAAADRRPGSAPKSNQAWISQYMYSLGIAVAGGTANIQRNVIAERGLGLPRDAAANRSAGK